MMLETFKRYLADKKVAEMFIHGQAGTGKTTGLSSLVAHCITNKIDYVVCAYTHQACGILRAKLPSNAVVVTLHKFLKKRPTINEHALNIKHIQNSQQQGVPDEVAVMFVDEDSMINEKDYSSIGDRQWLAGTDIPNMKVVYLGDPNQVGPIDGPAAIYPSGDYNIKLTKVYRQAGDNPILDTLTQLVLFIEGKCAPVPLKENSHFIRNIDIVKEYRNTSTSKIILAYTNKRVQLLNSDIAGSSIPTISDTVFSPTTKIRYMIGKFITPKNVEYIDLPFEGVPLTFNTKYRTLEHLLKMKGIYYALLHDELDGDYVMAYVFGHYSYKVKLEALGAAAVAINKQIGDKYKVSAKVWSNVNKGSILSRKRAKAWRDYFTFKNCVVCLDFPYAMTIHKSQGSTFDTVFLDTQDLGQCAARDYKAYLKLMYVAMSRTSNKVYTN